MQAQGFHHYNYLNVHRISTGLSFSLRPFTKASNSFFFSGYLGVEFLNSRDLKCYLGSTLKPPVHPQGWQYRQLINPLQGDPVDIKNICPVIGIHYAEIHFQALILAEVPGFLERKIQSVVPGQPTFIERTVPDRQIAGSFRV